MNDMADNPYEKIIMDHRYSINLSKRYGLPRQTRSLIASFGPDFLPVKLLGYPSYNFISRFNSGQGPYNLFDFSNLYDPYEIQHFRENPGRTTRKYAR